MPRARRGTYQSWSSYFYCMQWSLRVLSATSVLDSFPFIRRVTSASWRNFPYIRNAWIWYKTRARLYETSLHFLSHLLFHLRNFSLWETAEVLTIVSPIAFFVLYTQTSVMAEVFMRSWFSSQLFETGLLLFQRDVPSLTNSKQQDYHAPHCDWLTEQPTN